MADTLFEVSENLGKGEIEPHFEGGPSPEQGVHCGAGRVVGRPDLYKRPAADHSSGFNQGVGGHRPVFNEKGVDGIAGALRPTPKLFGLDYHVSGGVVDVCPGSRSR